jgi:UDP-arabinose 4-epimerase
VAYDNLSVGHEWAVRWGPLEVGDLADGIRLRQVLETHQPEAVLHFAASAYVGESMADPGKYFRNNLANTITLVDAMLDAGITRLVVSSSCASFGVPDALPVTDDAPQSPINVYGESKRLMERVLHWYAQLKGLHCVVLRYFNAAGADPDGEIGEVHDPEPHIIPILLQAAAGRRAAVKLFGTDYPTPDGTCVRDYVHVTDLAAAHLAALGRVRADGGFRSFNLGAGEGTSIRQLVAMVESVTGHRVPIVEEPRRAGDPPVLVAANERAVRELGWRPHHSDLRTIIESAWAWETRADGAVP